MITDCTAIVYSSMFEPTFQSLVKGWDRYIKNDEREKFFVFIIFDVHITALS